MTKNGNIVPSSLKLLVSLASVSILLLYLDPFSEEQFKYFTISTIVFIGAFTIKAFFDALESKSKLQIDFKAAFLNVAKGNLSNIVSNRKLNVFTHIVLGLVIVIVLFQILAYKRLILTLEKNSSVQVHLFKDRTKNTKPFITLTPGKEFRVKVLRGRVRFIYKCDCENCMEHSIQEKNYLNVFDFSVDRIRVENCSTQLY